MEYLYIKDNDKYHAKIISLFGVSANFYVIEVETVFKVIVSFEQLNKVTTDNSYTIFESNLLENVVTYMNILAHNLEAVSDCIDPMPCIVNYSNSQLNKVTGTGSPEGCGCNKN